RHALDDDGGAPADLDAAHEDADGLMQADGDGHSDDHTGVRLSTPCRRQNREPKHRVVPCLSCKEPRMRTVRSVVCIALLLGADVRLQTPLSSRSARVEQRFEATTILDTTLGSQVVVPAGSVARGFVSSVRPAGRIDRTGSLTLSFDEIVVNGKVLKLRASVV